jgi:hypothetical protein
MVRVKPWDVTGNPALKPDKAVRHVIDVSDYFLSAQRCTFGVRIWALDQTLTLLYSPRILFEVGPKD